MSLMLAPQPDRHRFKRNLKKSETRPVLPKHRFVLELHMAGYTTPAIQELTDYSQPMIYKILASDEINLLRQQIMKSYDQEFEALYSTVVKAVREGLWCDDMKERLNAAKIWLKAHGKFQGPKEVVGNQQINFTAEDIVFQILNQAPNQFNPINQNQSIIGGNDGQTETEKEAESEEIQAETIQAEE